MAKRDDSKAALRALGTHADAILDAYLSAGNRIEDSEANEKALAALSKHRLVWQTEDDDGMRLKNPLVRLLDGVTQAYRRQLANEHIGALWQSLTDAFQSYQEAIELHAFEDQARIQQDIQERMHEIIDDIRTATNGFFDYINTGFSYISTPHLRMQENARVIRQVDRLNQLFETFQVEELVALAGQNAFLRRLLLRHLRAAIEEARTTLAVAADKLWKLLNQLRENQRLNRLVGALAAHYMNHPGFIPSLDGLDLDQAPETINQCPPFTIWATADLLDFHQADTAAELVQKVRRNTELAREIPEADPEPVVDDMAGESVIDVPDPMEVAVEELLAALLQGAGGPLRVSVAEVRARYFADFDPVEWLYCVATELDGLPPARKRQLVIDYQALPDPLFDGNELVYDICIGNQGVVA